MISIDNIVVDTGASFCIIEPSVLDELGIAISVDDEIETFYGVNGVYNYIKRTSDHIELDKDMILNDIEFYIGTVDESINGLLGLDLLMKSKAIIDLAAMEIIFKKNQ